MKRRLWCGRGQYRSTNSELAARAWPPLPSSEPRSLPPPPFAFDHPPQSLTARWAAKLLARAATGECKPLFASRTLAAKKFAITRWALALAGLRRAGVGGFRRGREHFLGLSGLPTFGAATSIPLALSLPFLPPIRGLSILPVGASSPPSPSGGPAFGTAISGLGVGGMKGLLTSLEKTPSLTRPTSPLTGPRFAASWCWAQGSCELPTAKPRMRSPYLRSEAPSLINSALVGVRHSHLKADPLVGPEESNARNSGRLVSWD
jgi:hypothetical protein